MFDETHEYVDVKSAFESFLELQTYTGKKQTFYFQELCRWIELTLRLGSSLEDPSQLTPAFTWREAKRICINAFLYQFMAHVRPYGKNWNQFAHGKGDLCCCVYQMPSYCPRPILCFQIHETCALEGIDIYQTRILRSVFTIIRDGAKRGDDMYKDAFRKLEVKNAHVYAHGPWERFAVDQDAETDIEDSESKETSMGDETPVDALPLSLALVAHIDTLPLPDTDVDSCRTWCNNVRNFMVHAQTVLDHPSIQKSLQTYLRMFLELVLQFRPPKGKGWRDYVRGTYLPCCSVRLDEEEDGFVLCFTAHRAGECKQDGNDELGRDVLQDIFRIIREGANDKIAVYKQTLEQLEKDSLSWN